MATPFLLAAFVRLSFYRSSLLRYLPAWPGLAEATLAEVPVHGDPYTLVSARGWLETLHYSWLLDVVRPLHAALRAQIFSVLPSALEDKLLSLVPTPPPLLPASPLTTPFLLHWLQKQLCPEEWIPRMALPPSPLGILLNLSKSQLLNLIDLLAMHDLAPALKHILDSAQLNHIYAALSQQQLQFLHYCSRQTIKGTRPSLALKGWSGSKEQLQKLIHVHGLARLGVALQGESPAFVWHLLHFLDTGRAQWIQQSYTRPVSPAQLPYFTNQVLHIATRYHP